MVVPDLGLPIIKKNGISLIFSNIKGCYQIIYMANLEKFRKYCLFKIRLKDQ